MGHPPTRPGGIGKDEKRNTTKRQTVKMKEDQKPHPLLNCAKDGAPTHPRPYLTLGVGHPSTHAPTALPHVRGGPPVRKYQSKDNLPPLVERSRRKRLHYTTT